MQQTSLRLVALGCITVLAACTGGQSGSLPAFTSTNVPATSKLQFAVGTANYNGTAALNTVATFRQVNGLSATFLNTPSIVGPAGFTVPAAVSAGIDAGTGSITSTAQTLPGNTPTLTTFGQSGGVYAYGFAPLNSTTTTQGLGSFYREPFYSTSQIRPLLGPPAEPTVTDGNTSPGFAGYPAGFTSFAGVALFAGTYTLNVLVPSADPKFTSNLTATATLASTALLPVYAPPVFTSDTVGGGSVAVIAPAGVTETIVFVRDFNPNVGSTYYSVVLTGTGAQTAVFANNIGPSSPKGGATAPFTTGDTVSVAAVGFDYGAFEAAPPGNVSQMPTIVGASGQADLTASPVVPNTY